MAISEVIVEENERDGAGCQSNGDRVRRMSSQMDKDPSEPDGHLMMRRMSSQNSNISLDELDPTTSGLLAWNIAVEDPTTATNKKELHPIEGSWRLLSNENFDTYLSSIGVTPLMAQMVVRSNSMMTILEDLDKCWKILTETSIKAKSIKGYKTRNYKMTSNKFALNQPKPELLDDWDPRLVVTTITFDEDDHETLIMDQAAEKDQKYCKSSKCTLSVDEDILTVTLETEDGVKAVRRYIRHKIEQHGTGKRKISAPF